MDETVCGFAQSACMRAFRTMICNKGVCTKVVLCFHTGGCALPSRPFVLSHVPAEARTQALLRERATRAVRAWWNKSH